MTTEQTHKIKQARQAVLGLAQQQDQLFNKLIEELEFTSYLQKWADGSDPDSVRGKNPVNWLFDVVFNASHNDQELTDTLAKIENLKEVYDNYGNV